MIDYLRSADLYWEGARVRFGLVLTGEKLVDNKDYREQLREFEPEAIGGEMEGAGLYVACQDAKTDWILVKAICDWADGNKSVGKDARQEAAALNAAAFVVHALKAVPLVVNDAPHESPDGGPEPFELRLWDDYRDMVPPDARGRLEPSHWFRLYVTNVSRRDALGCRLALEALEPMPPTVIPGTVFAVTAASNMESCDIRAGDEKSFDIGFCFEGRSKDGSPGALFLSIVHDGPKPVGRPDALWVQVRLTAVGQARPVRRVYLLRWLGTRMVIEPGEQHGRSSLPAPSPAAPPTIEPGQMKMYVPEVEVVGSLPELAADGDGSVHVVIPRVDIINHSDEEVDLDVELGIKAWNHTRVLLESDSPAARAGTGTRLQTPLRIGRRARAVGYVSSVVPRALAEVEGITTDRADIERIELLLTDGVSHVVLPEEELWPSIWPQVLRPENSR